MPARTRSRPPTHEFSLVLAGVDVLDPARLDAWFEAGCDDATFGEVDGIGYADFARESPTAPEAILSAIEDVESAVSGTLVIRIEPDEFLSASDIAVRLKRTRESVRLLISGDRGPGGFPAPVSHLKTRGRIWRWAEVARWIDERLSVRVPGVETATFIAALNDALDLRRLAPELAARDQLEHVESLLPKSHHTPRTFAGSELDALRKTDWFEPLQDLLGPGCWSELEAFLRHERSIHDIYPPPGEVFAAFQLTPLAKTKVVILGQDPYASPGQAHGLAFSVRRGVPIPGTLRNIFKELRSDYPGPTRHHGNLESWAQQGVLLLNTALTVPRDGSKAHLDDWKAFTTAVLRVAGGSDDRVFILWGNEAKEMKRLINARPEMIIESSHPSDRAAHISFFGSHPFKKANDALEMVKRDPIIWNLTD